MSPKVVAVGDSITNGKTMDIGPLLTESYAYWVAQSLGTTADIYAISGAPSQRIADEVLPKITGRYDVGLGYVGTNDIISRGWDPQRLHANISRVAEALLAHADRVVLLTFPARLGAVPTVWPYGPGRAGRIATANRLVEQVGRAAGASVVDLRDLRGRYNIWSDRLHPTSRGQVLIADEIVKLLTPAATLPSTTVADRWQKPDLRWQWWYSRTSAKQAVRRPVATLARAVIRR